MYTYLHKQKIYLFFFKVDSYGTQQPIALLKLLFEKGGFYGREKDLNWMMIRDISKYISTLKTIF